MIAKLLFVALSSLIIIITLYKKKFELYQISLLLLNFLFPFNITGSILHFPELSSYYTQLHIHFLEHKIISNYLIPYISVLDIITLLNLFLFSFDTKIKLITRFITIALILFLIGLNFTNYGLISALTIYRWTIYPLSLVYLTSRMLRDWFEFLDSGDLEKRKNLINLSFAVTIVTIINLLIEIILSSYQITVKHSLGVYFLGESKINIGASGYISKVIMLGNTFLRGYGSFPHPNVLANYTLFTILIVLISKKTIQYKDILWKFYGKLAARRLNKLLDVTLLLAAINLLLTFSRIPIFLGILALLYYLYRYQLNPQIKQVFLYLSGSVLIVLFLFIYFETNWQSSFANRYALNLLAINIIQFSFPRGLGPGQFVSAFDIFHIISNGQSFIQPVHNIYLLLMSEIGIWGFFFSICILGIIFALTIGAIRYKEYDILLFSLYILIETNIDHLFLTQPQGIILFSITLIITNLYLFYWKLGGPIHISPPNK